MKNLVCNFLVIFFLFHGVLLAEKIALIDWNRDGLYEDGFRDEILGNIYNVRFYSFSCMKDRFLLEEYIKFIKRLDVDLIYVVGFPAIKRISEVFLYIPVVFVTNSDPVKLGLVASYKSSENNLTGVVAKIPILQQLKILKKIVNFKHVGIVKIDDDFEYLLTLKELVRLEKFLNYKTIIFNNFKDIKNELLTKLVDVLYIYKSQKIDNSIIGLANNYGIITLAADSNAVRKKGALISLIVDEYRVGRIAGKKAIKIINGIKVSKIPVTPIEHFMLVINLKTAKRININIPLSLLIMTDKIIQ